MNEMNKRVIMIDELLVNIPVLNNNFVKEQRMEDVKYLKETGGLKMIVDSGAPLSIVSENSYKSISIIRKQIRKKYNTKAV